MCCTLIGLLMISAAPQYLWLIIGSVVMGAGSSILHPESSRVARMASGGRFGIAQSVFQLGGNAGQAFGPLLVAVIVTPRGLYSLSWLAVLPSIAIVLLLWIRGYEADLGEANARVMPNSSLTHPKGMVLSVFVILLILIFSRFFYVAAINNYFIFYLTHKFGISVQAAQMRLFVFMFATAAGTMFGGLLGDRIGQRYIIWFSILGAAPFTLAMPYLNLEWTGIMIFVIGFILSAAFPAIVVFAQELLPGHVGAVAGLFFGFSFGMGGIGAAILGKTADVYGIETVYNICSFLPLIGFLAVFLPTDRKIRESGRTL